MDSNDMLAKSSDLLKDLRAKGCLVLHVPMSFADGKTFQKGTSAVEFHPSMKPEAGDMIVDGKLGLCSFFSTNLDLRLRQRGIKNVVLGGFLTNCCIESTMRTAYEHGYNVYTLKDCTAATSVAAHEKAYEHSFGMFSTVTSAAEVKAAVAAE